MSCTSARRVLSGVVLTGPGGWVLGLLCAAALLAGGCSDEKNPARPTGKVIAKVTVSVAGGGTGEFLARRQTKQLLATAAADDGSSEDVTNRVFWQSSNTAVAIVSPAGLVTALDFGSAVIEATLLGRTGQLPIVVKDGCVITLDPPSLTYPGGVSLSASIAVTTLPRDCRWTVAGDADWLTLYGPAPVGMGNGYFYVSAPYNNTTAERVARVTVTAHQGSSAVFLVRQQAPTCVVTINPVARAFSRAGGVGQFAVSVAPATCRWAAAAEYGTPQIRIDGGASGEGPGTVVYTVSPNTTGYTMAFSILVTGGAPGESVPVRHSITIDRY